MIDNVLILAGGSGTRLWPASLSRFPKQFIKVKDDYSLLQLTVKRALELDVRGKIYIITLRKQMEAVLEECREFLPGGKIAVIPEPEARNTAPAIGLAARYMELSGEADSSLLVLPADHMISNTVLFSECVEKADILSRKGFLVTFGIKPLYPETGYGYIEQGEKEEPGYRIRAFREKPDEKTAEKYIASGKCLWNSGMFCFRGDTYLRELEKHAPEIYASLASVEKAETRTENGVLIAMDSGQTAQAYGKTPSISIDYAVMEKSSSSAVVSADFDWNDIGSWDQFETLLKGRKEDDVFRVNSENSTVFSDIPVALCDVDDIIVVIKNGKALVCKKGSSQKLRDVLGLIRENGRQDLT